MNDQERNPVFLGHYVFALGCMVAGLVVRDAWFCGFGTFGIIAWMYRARRA